MHIRSIKLIHDRYQNLGNGFCVGTISYSFHLHLIWNQEIFTRASATVCLNWWQSLFYSHFNKNMHVKKNFHREDEWCIKTCTIKDSAKQTAIHIKYSIKYSTKREKGRELGRVCGVLTYNTKASSSSSSSSIGTYTIETDVFENH